MCRLNGNAPTDIAAPAAPALPPSRGELSALLKAVNDPLQAQVHELADTATVPQALVSGRARAPSP
jgi:hypothetical protein